MIRTLIIILISTLGLLGQEHTLRVDTIFNENDSIVVCSMEYYDTICIRSFEGIWSDSVYYESYGLFKRKRMKVTETRIWPRWNIKTYDWHEYYPGLRINGSGRELIILSVEKIK